MEIDRETREQMEGYALSMMSKHTYVPKHSGAQAHVHEEGSVEGDWVFGKVELDLRVFVISTSRRIPPAHNFNEVPAQSKLTPEPVYGERP
jgi:hypothetical protein